MNEITTAPVLEPEDADRHILPPELHRQLLATARRAGLVTSEAARLDTAQG